MMGCGKRLLKAGDTGFSETCQRELGVLKGLIDNILDDTKSAFCDRDTKAAFSIEPKVHVVTELINEMTKNHFRRMSAGECSLLADALFSNLMGEYKRISGVCSNVGIATLVRIRPELASNEHLFFESLDKSGDADYNKVFEETKKVFFDQLRVQEETAGG